MPNQPTEAQREASRRNGATSRGPRTEACKARSALNGVKLDLVTQMVNAQWRLRRVHSHESALADIEITIQHDDLHEVFAKVDTETAQALAFKAIAVHDPTVLERLDRAEVRLTRQYDRALRSLLLLRRNMTTKPEVSAAVESVTSEPAITSEPETGVMAGNPEPETEGLPDANTVDDAAPSRYEFQPGRPRGAANPDSRLGGIVTSTPTNPSPEGQQ